MIEYSDFQCPYCGKFARDIEPELVSTYVKTGRVLWAFQNLPLENLHPKAIGAAEAAECAGDQGQFWSMHDLLFADQAHLDDPSLLQRAASLHVAMPAFKACLGGTKTNMIRDEASAAKTLKVDSTPVFFFGTRSLSDKVKVIRAIPGIVQTKEFSSVLDELLRSQGHR